MNGNCLGWDDDTAGPLGAKEDRSRKPVPETQATTEPAGDAMSKVDELELIVKLQGDRMDRIDNTMHEVVNTLGHLVTQVANLVGVEVKP